MEKQFKVFKNKKVLITGHTGFKVLGLLYGLAKSEQKSTEFHLKVRASITLIH